MKRSTHRSVRTSTLGVATVLLAGGLAGGMAAPATASAPGPDTASTTTHATCDGPSAEEALDHGLSRLSAPVPGSPDVVWDAQRADTSGYDPCAELSWMTVPVEGATASSPTAILLFHHGSYLGTASAEHFGYDPAVERTSDGSLTVTYRWPRPGDANAAPTGTSVSEFTWDGTTGSVVHEGEFPPQG